MEKTPSVILLALVCCVAAAQEEPTAIAGGTARTAALGGNPGNPYIMDYSDVFSNPAWAARYADLVYGDLGYSFSAYRASGQYLGVTMDLDPLFVGISIGRREGPMFSENSYGSSVVPFAASDYMITGINNHLGFGTGEPIAPIQVYSALGLGDLTFGAAVYYSSWSREDNNSGFAGLGETWEISNDQIGIKAGGTMKLTQALMIDASALLRINGSSTHFSDTATGAAISARGYEASGTEVTITARAFLTLDNSFTLIPQARFSTFSYEPELAQTPNPPAPFNSRPNKYGRSEFEIGIGLNRQLSAGLIVIGLSYQRISLQNDITSVAGTQLQTTKNTVTWTDVPKINLGTEFEVLSWLTGRIGYFKRISSRKIVSSPPAPGISSEQIISVDQGYLPSLGLSQPDQQLSLGLAILVRGISLDGYVGERFLAAGPYVLSGNVQDLFCVLSMSYTF